MGEAYEKMVEAHIVIGTGHAADLLWPEYRENRKSHLCTLLSSIYKML